jgi:hypothetical protein
VDDTHGILVDAMKIIPMVVWAPHSVFGLFFRKVASLGMDDHAIPSAVKVIHSLRRRSDAPLTCRPGPVE